MLQELSVLKEGNSQKFDIQPRNCISETRQLFVMFVMLKKLMSCFILPKME